MSPAFFLDTHTFFQIICLENFVQPLFLLLRAFSQSVAIIKDLRIDKIKKQVAVHFTITLEAGVPESAGGWQGPSCCFVIKQRVSHAETACMLAWSLLLSFCFCVCLSTCTHACTHTCAHTHTSTYMHTCVNMHVHTRTNVYTHAHIHTCTYTHTYGGQKSVFCVYLHSQLYFFDTESFIEHRGQFS